MCCNNNNNYCRVITPRLSRAGKSRTRNLMFESESATCGSRGQDGKNPRDESCATAGGGSGKKGDKNESVTIAARRKSGRAI